MASIRPATDNDLETLYAFEQGIVEAERPFDPTLKLGIIHYYDLKELISSANACVLVAEEDGKILASGYADIHKAKDYLNHERFAHLGFMFTRPEARGRGLNKMILDELRNWIATKGITEIRLQVYPGNEIAKQAYEKFGFKEYLLEMRLT